MSEYSKRASYLNEYKKDKYEELKIRFCKDGEGSCGITKEMVLAAAARSGLSVNEYMIRAFNMAMNYCDEALQNEMRLWVYDNGSDGSCVEVGDWCKVLDAARIKAAEVDEDASLYFVLETQWSEWKFDTSDELERFLATKIFLKNEKGEIA